MAALSRMGAYVRVIRAGMKALDRLQHAFPWLVPRKMHQPGKEKEIDWLNRAVNLVLHQVYIDG